MAELTGVHQQILGTFGNRGSVFRSEGERGDNRGRPPDRAGDWNKNEARWRLKQLSDLNWSPFTANNVVALDHCRNAN
jgi:hypothetical protein